MKTIKFSMAKRLLLLASLFYGLSIYSQNYYILKTKGTDFPYTINYVDTGKILLNEPVVDSLSRPISMPFNWVFYGQTVNEFKASNYGYISFNTATLKATGNNTILPNSSSPYNSIFAFWDQIELKGIPFSVDKVQCRYFVYGVAPERVMVVQWYNVSKKGANAGSNNYFHFAIRMYEAGGFDIVYNDCAPFLTGLSATIGCQNGDASQGICWKNTDANDFPNKLGKTQNATDVVFKFIYAPQPLYDLTIVKSRLQKIYGLNSPMVVKGRFLNLGSQNITSYKLNYRVEGDTAVYSDSIASALIEANGESADFSSGLPYTFTSTGHKMIEIWASELNAVGDSNTINDTLFTSVYVMDSVVVRKPLLEQFTSSTCNPCKSGNTNLQGILSTQTGKFTVINYPYYFPERGDPYFTSEGFARGESYYASYQINTLPRLLVDGKWNDDANNYTNALFNEALEPHSPIVINAQQVLRGDSVIVGVTIKPTGNLLPGNYRIRMALLEKQNVQNAKTNGEKEFFWVMKKMLPDANGYAFTNTLKGQTTQFTDTFVLPGTYRLPAAARFNTTQLPSGINYTGINTGIEHSVEHNWNLICVVFVQNDSTKEVIQSAWSAPNYQTALNENKPDFSPVLQVFPNPANETTTLRYTVVDKTPARISLHDMSGREIKLLMNKTLSQGSFELNVETYSLQSGIYFIKLESASDAAIVKMLISH